MEKQETKEAKPRSAKAPAKAKKRKRRRLSQKPPKDEVARVRLALAAVVAELRTQQELAPETLAARARITVRELVRCEEGKPGTLETFAALGGALGYDPGDVLHPEEDCGAEKSSYSFLLLDISNEDGREILA